MMVDILEAESRFSELLRRVEAGEEVIISRAGRPMARLTPYEYILERRLPGGWNGRVHMTDDFDRLPDEYSGAWFGVNDDAS